MTKLFAIAGHFVSYRWVSGLHNFLVILWNLLKTKKKFHQQKQTTNESNNCWSRLNASQAARHSFVGRMFVTPVPHKNANSNVSWLYLLFTQKLQCRWCDRLPNGMIWAVVTMKRTRKVNTNAHRSSRVSRPRSEFRQRVPVEKSAASPTSLPQVEEALLCGHYASASSLICLKNAILDMSWWLQTGTSLQSQGKRSNWLWKPNVIVWMLLAS